MRTSRDYLKLLPNNYKKVGITLLFLLLLGALLLALSHPNVSPKSRDLFESIFLSIAVLALFLVAVSKDKIEDELIQSLRMRSMSISLLFAVVYSIINPFLNCLFDIPLTMDAHQLILSVLVFYLLLFFLMKKAR